MIIARARPPEDSPEYTLVLGRIAMTPPWLRESVGFIEEECKSVPVVMASVVGLSVHTYGLSQSENTRLPHTSTCKDSISFQVVLPVSSVTPPLGVFM